MIMLPPPPKFFAAKSLRHVIWQIELLDSTLTVSGRMLTSAATREGKAAALKCVNDQLDNRLELMRQRDALQGEGKA